jgi:hypothetical protein
VTGIALFPEIHLALLKDSTQREFVISTESVDQATINCLEDKLI